MGYDYSKSLKDFNEFSKRILIEEKDISSTADYNVKKPNAVLQNIHYEYLPEKEKEAKMIINLGLFSKSDIMGYELVRFCNILNTNIVGGASKLLKEFIRQYSPKYIISYSSNDISFGNLYNTLGFESGEVSTSYWYIEPETMHRYHRTSFSRSGIAEKFGYDIKDMSWSEHNVMDELRYIRIYDAGTTRWILSLF